MLTNQKVSAGAHFLIEPTCIIITLAQFKFEVIDVTKLNIQTLLDKIFYDEESGGPTNLILNFYNSNSDCQQKLRNLYECICPMQVIDPRYSLLNSI